MTTDTKQSGCDPISGYAPISGYTPRYHDIHPDIWVYPDQKPHARSASDLKSTLQGISETSILQGIGETSIVLILLGGAGGRQTPRCPWKDLKFPAGVCYAVVLPGRKSVFRAGFRPDSNRESIKIGPSAGRRSDFDAFPTRILPKSGPEDRFPARKHYCVT